MSVSPATVFGTIGIVIVGMHLYGAMKGDVVALIFAGVGLLLAQLLLVRTKPTRTPVVMLHSIAATRDDRPETFDIWCPPSCFEGYLRYLKRRGFETITLEQLHDHVANEAPIPDKPIVLTFDDGYLDNWVYAAPLLQKYGFTGTVFMPSDFIQPGDTPRPSLRDVWEGRTTEEELEVYGYLNEAELYELSRSGVLDVQSHGKTHTWLPISDEVVDFHHPDLRMRHLRWMWWNRHPDEKPFWFHRIAHEGVPWGAPVYRNELALSSPAVTPDPKLEEILVEHVAVNGGRAFFDRDRWRDELQAIVKAHRASGQFQPAKPETDAEFRARLRDELAGSRDRLESITGRPVRFMCWPNGGVCDEAFTLLDSCGYLGATLPSRAKQPHNHLGTRADRIGRISATSYFRGDQNVFRWTLSFALKVERNRGLLHAEIPIKAIWLYRKIVPARGPKPHGAEV
jgi:peptidoglycan/xylan/chitin deacetylase (PgdA/CDA1 family)